jgi:outer membrane protein TolC
MNLRTLLVVVALAASTAPATAQEPVPERLSLADAIEIARTTNPGFLQTRNDEALADWDVKAAYGQLLPTASASGGVSWQGSGDIPLAGGVTIGDLGLADQPSFYSSRYSIGVNYSMNWATLLAPRQAKAQRGATLDGIGVAEASLISQVTSLYVDMLRQVDAVRIAEQQLENAELNLRLAQGQLEVGQVTPIDVGQAEVQVGRAQVTLLQTQNSRTTSRMRLLQALGLSVEQQFEPTKTFELSEPTWTLAELTEMAMADNPELLRRRSSTDAADVAVSSVWSQYFPTLSLGMSWSAFTREASSTDLAIAQAQAGVASSIQQCVRTNDIYSRLTPPIPPIDCSQIAFTDAQAGAIIAQNDQFPFDFTRSPPTLSLNVSIPIFTGLSRERDIQAAKLQREDLRQQVREQELAVQADLAIGLETARTLYESALLEDRNRQLAEQQLNLARERYQLGAITFVELVDAQTVFVNADADRTRAVFAYHDAVTTLEALVGATLR